jgi:hypothetical protein
MNLLDMKYILLNCSVGVELGLIVLQCRGLMDKLINENKHKQVNMKIYKILSFIQFHFAKATWQSFGAEQILIAAWLYLCL